MKKKRMTYIVSTFLLLVGATTSIFANESFNSLAVSKDAYQEIGFQQALNDEEYDNTYKNGIYGIMLNQSITDSQIDNKTTVEKSSDNEMEPKLDNSATTVASRGTTSHSKYNADDLYWLAKIIEAEAKGEPYNGKVAVGNVILNRVDSDEFPDTIHDVIFEYHGSIPQFSPVADGSIHNTPSQESIRAAKDAVNGVAPVGDATYFFNPSKASGAWIVNNKSYVMNISGHNFYR